MKSICLAAAVSTLVAGCASYTENGLFGGFTDTPLAGDTYRIQAYGNAYTSRGQTNAIAMVRAADLAAQNGYDRFIVFDYDEWASTAYYTSPTTVTTDSTTNTNLYAQGYGYSVGGHQYADIYGSARSRTTSTTTINHGQTYEISKPRTDMVIRFISNDSLEYARALRVTDIFARYGKMAGYKPKEMQLSTQAAVSVPPQKRDEPLDSSPAPSKSAPDTVRATSERSLPTLDEVYKSLSAGEKARVNRLPPAQRADYLTKIRDTRF